MSMTPRLPEGYHAQPAFHHQEGRVGFDFYRVYNAQRELDPLRSYWLLTEDSDVRGPMPPKTRWAAFADWARAHFASVDDFHQFANPQTPLDEVRKWIEATPSGDLIEVEEP